MFQVNLILTWMTTVLVSENLPLYSSVCFCLASPLKKTHQLLHNVRYKNWLNDFNHIGQLPRKCIFFSETTGLDQIQRFQKSSNITPQWKLYDTEFKPLKLQDSFFFFFCKIMGESLSCDREDQYRRNRKGTKKEINAQLHSNTHQLQYLG